MRCIGCFETGHPIGGLWKGWRINEEFRRQKNKRLASQDVSAEGTQQTADFLHILKQIVVLEVAKIGS